MLFFFSGIQGIILSLILLFSKKHRKRANQFLAIFLLLFSLNTLRNHYSDYYFDTIQSYPIIYMTTWSFYSFFGPFFYLYIKSLTGHQINIRNTIKKHFIFPTSYFALMLYAGVQRITSEEDVSTESIEYYLYTVFSILVIILLLIYLISALKIIWKYHKTLRDQFSNIDKLKLNWLFQFTIGLLIIYILWITLMGGDILIFKENLSGNVVNIFRTVSAIYVYWVGYYALLKPEVFVEEKPTVVKNITQNTLISDEDIDVYKTKLIKLLEEDKVFLNGSLTLNQLAKKLKTNSKTASQVINIGFEKTFYDLINSYRIKEVKQNLLDPNFKNYTLEAIAFNSGFKSSTTFNRLFKSYTQQTPNQYRNTHLK